MSLDDAIDKFTAEYIWEALVRNEFDRQRTGEELRISQSGLRNKIALARSYGYIIHKCSTGPKGPHRGRRRRNG